MGAPCLIPGQGTNIPQTVLWGKNRKEKKKERKKEKKTAKINLKGIKSDKYVRNQ